MVQAFKEVADDNTEFVCREMPVIRHMDTAAVYLQIRY